MTRTIASLWRAPLAAALLVGSAAIAAPASADTPMMVGLDGVYVTEADSGTTPMVFTATLSAVPTSTVSLRFQTFVLHSPPQPSDATPGGSCTQGVDYIAVDQVVSIPANADPPQATVSVPVCGDTVSEGNEVINARLTNLPANVSCQEICLGWATIYDNDSLPAASVANASSVEGDGGRFSLIQHVNFPVTLDGPSASTITVQYATAPTQAVTKE